MNNINSNFNLNYRPTFKSSQKSEDKILVDKMQQKFDTNFSTRPETQKKALHGLLLASTSCGIIALGDMLISGTIKTLEGNIKFTEIINPKKSMSKLGKWGTAIVGTFILAENIIKGFLLDKKN